MSLKELYEHDEPAWLEAMARLIEKRDYADLDFENLLDFLKSAASREQREVAARLRALMALVLKKELNPWKDENLRSATLVQRHHLQKLLESPSLLEHAKVLLPTAYDQAVELAAAEAGLKESCFPAECPYTVDGLLSNE